jgi:2-polyprenyl-6-methoxyphenol hydroxylase-like FAD-dependent oxidoreductase
MAELGEHAVVLGASMGGLLAARVLSDFYRTVTVVERDELPDDPADRRGVPQGRHTHALLARGAQVLEELFPGILDELVADGAPAWDDWDLSKLHLCFSGHLMLQTGTVTVDPKDPTALPMYLPSRRFLECHVRNRLRALRNVTVRSGHDVAELMATADGRRVTGARVVDRNSGAETELVADVVMDAMGRSAHTPSFLESLGYGRPVEDHIVMRTTYVSQRVRIPAGTLHEQFVNITPVVARPTGMFLIGTENDTWILTVFGLLGNEPPRDLAGMLEFAKEYAPAHLLSAVRAGEPIGEPTQHRMPFSQWRRYDKMRRFPQGLLVCGDAICSFNPIYGQGMTVAAVDAAALRDCLRRGTDDLAHRYFRAAAKMIGVAWQTAAMSDLAFPEAEGKRPRSLRITNKLVDWALTACETDEVVLKRFSNVNGLIAGPESLIRPGLIYRVAAANLRGRRHAREARPAAPVVSPS